ncbi:MAG: hypothetical protein CME61_06630 [Halobacteriovoraceae bacterium]|nr:hypothetical protein [Halobacteriovoraceae bacterium]|tara:strand:- start:103 stop:585 length:483 start_codon:yes stop_codon:yes gene_type:complete
MGCHCGENESFEDCCNKFIEGIAKPETAEQLMRSRYSAFVVGATDYVFNTHHADSRGDVSKEEIENWSKSSKWNGLEIVRTSDGGNTDESGEVEFIARYSTDGNEYAHHERASFKKVDEHWYFVDGQILKEVIKNPHKNVGRNDPCICGSGKKYKKCCLN